VDTIPPAYWTKVYFGGSSCGTRRFLLLIGVTLLGLAPAACARLPSHFAVPQLAVADAAFIPTLEAYTLIPTSLSSSDLPVRRYVT